MSYLKLDGTQINYQKQVSNPHIFVSEIPDSDCSYVTPKLITSSDELDIYFGKSFTQRDYYNELLFYGASLLLYKPIKGETYGESVIDISEYKEILEYSYNPPVEKDYIFFENLPKNGIPEDEEEPGEWLFYVSTEGVHYIWYEGEYIKETEIPEDRILSSTLNRDTLRLIDIEFSHSGKFSWCNPNYPGSPEYTEDISGFEDSLLQSIYSHGIDDDEKSICYTLDFSEVKEFRDTDYIVFPLPSNQEYFGSRIQFYFGDTAPLGADIISGALSYRITGDDKITSILESLESFGYRVIKESEKRFIIYTSDMIPDQRFYTVSGLIFEPSKEFTQHILTLLSKDHGRLEIYSKTIGPGDENIKVKIESIQGKTEYYRFTISRYSYQEIFEGPLYLEKDSSGTNFTSLERIINQGSNLVEIKINNQGRDRNKPEDGLMIGEFFLSGSKSEKASYVPEDYWRSLEILKNTEISEDFLLIPEIEKYEIQGASSDLDYIYEYKELLEYSKSKNCQVLISNHPWKFGCTDLIYLDSIPENPEEGIMYGIKTSSKVILYQSFTNGVWKIYNSDPEHKFMVHEIEEAFGKEYTGNHIFNYTNDKENRLVYFYSDLNYLGYQRPAYYVFLGGILTGDYNPTTDNILYTSPVDLYSEDSSGLRKYKSNFLSCNNHIYYYRELFNHPGDWKYDMTILTRFCMDKVTNTVLRDFPYYLGSETSGEIVEGLRKILEGLKTRYPIIYSLDMDYIEEDTLGQTISVHLTLGVREILENDIKLSVILNFNNT